MFILRSVAENDLESLKKLSEMPKEKLAFLVQMLKTQ
jgi:hypothetical protein